MHDTLNEGFLIDKKFKEQKTRANGELKTDYETPDQLINDVKKILHIKEVYGDPSEFEIKPYGIGGVNQITILCSMHGKDITKISLTAATTMNNHLIKSKITSMKEYKFKKNNDINTLQRILRIHTRMDELKFSIKPNCIIISYSPLVARKNCEKVVSKFPSVGYKSITNQIIIPNKGTSIKESGLLEFTDNENSVTYLLSNTPMDRIFLTSDWHIFRRAYQPNRNDLINPMKAIEWCQTNIGSDDVLIFLGDLSYEKCSEDELNKAKEIYQSLPGQKILVLGNHDKMLGPEFYNDCGFDYIFEQLSWGRFIFSHYPLKMEIRNNDLINLHGHKHNNLEYNITQGDRNINVYPLYYGGVPVSLEEILNKAPYLVKDHYFKPGDTMVNEAVKTRTYTRGKVYFSSTIDSETIAYMVSLFHKKLSGKIAIKLHFGEKGNNNYLPPELLEDLSIYTRGTFVDSNVAYGGPRAKTKSHIEVAKEHGFGFAPIDILDADGDYPIKVPRYDKINNELNKARTQKIYMTPISMGTHLSEVYVGTHIKNYDSMVVYTHVKGHDMAGYGGAIKNIGMGVPSGKRGKVQVHGSSFMRSTTFLERLVESASAVQNLFKDRIVFVNILANISTKCDCDAEDIHPAMKDIGVLVSDDILSIEQASFDLINAAQDNHDVMEVISTRGGIHQLEYADWLGIGSPVYTLYDITDTRLPSTQTESAFLGFAMLETPRSELKDSQFGIPEDRKYPLDTEQHVRSAIKLFGHAEESKKKALAKRIKRAATAYGIEIPPTTQCGKYLKESVEEDKDLIKLIGLSNDGFELMDTNNMSSWYISNERNTSSIEEDDYCNSFDEALDKYYNNWCCDCGDCCDCSKPIKKAYVFTQNVDDPSMAVCVGIINVYPDKHVDWEAEYVFPVKDPIVDEWAMVSCNPIKGIHKPFILKVGGDPGVINTKQFVFSPDVIADKYLVINEKNKLQTVDKSYIENLNLLGEYKFVGNPDMIGKIAKAYYEDAYVDRTFFYTALTGKPMLTEDQIDFDESFVRIDPKQIETDILTENATFMSQVLEATDNLESVSLPLMESQISNTLPEYISIREDVNGYFYTNSLTNKRTISVKSLKDLNEYMLNSILK